MSIIKSIKRAAERLDYFIINKAPDEVIRLEISNLLIKIKSLKNW